MPSKTTKTTAKTATKTASKTKPTTATELRKVLVSRDTMAYCLGVMSTTVTQLAQQGILRPDTDTGYYPAMEGVASYISKLRQELKEAKKAKHSQDDELTFWKTEKTKQQVKSWRQSRDREIALQVLAAIRNAINALKDSCRQHPDLLPAIEDAIKAIDTVDLDRVSDIVEGDTDTEDDD